MGCAVWDITGSHQGRKFGNRTVKEKGILVKDSALIPGTVHSALPFWATDTPFTGPNLGGASDAPVQPIKKRTSGNSKVER